MITHQTHSNICVPNGRFVLDIYRGTWMKTNIIHFRLTIYFVRINICVTVDAVLQKVTAYRCIPLYQLSSELVASVHVCMGV